jgi:hypothetical protein
MSAAALPRVVIIDQNGSVHFPDPRLSDAVAKKVSPPLAAPDGRLPAGDSVVLADVFVISRNAVRLYPYMIRPAPQATPSDHLPKSKATDTTECPRQNVQRLFPDLAQ